MEHNHIRFRNHFSIILEQIGSFLFFLAAVGVTGLLKNYKELTKDASLEAGDVRILGFIFLGILAILLLIGLISTLVWSKTYISIRDNTLVLERNTLNKKIHTIGIKNISNVNMEQNLFEMLIGTCKLKLDTNTLSTADSTDVKIILKKSDALRFKNYLMKLITDSASGEHKTSDESKASGEYKTSGEYKASGEYKTSGEYEASGERKLSADSASASDAEDDLSFDITSGLGEMLIHGFFSANLFSLLVVLGTVVIAVESALHTFETGFTGKSIFEILAGLLVVAVFFFTALLDILKGFVKYHGFRVTRSHDRLYIRYGFFKKVSYTIPVDKINALKLTQTPLARLTGRYMAEIINVGMGDDEAEKQSFLLLYDRKENIDKHLSHLLPEFAGAVTKPVSPQPASVWVLWMISYLIYCIFAAAGTSLLVSLFPKYRFLLLSGVVIISIFILLSLLFKSKTAGTRIEPDYLIAARGSLRRQLICLRYEKIQYLELSQSFVAKRLGILKGCAYLLASAADKSQSVPYFCDKDAERLKEKILSADSVS